MLREQKDVRAQDHQRCLAPMCCHQPLRQVAAFYSIALQVQTYLLPGFAHGSRLVIFVCRVASATGESYVGSPSVSLTGGTLDEEHFGVAMLDPVLVAEIGEVARTRSGWIRPVGEGRVDPDDKSDGCSFFGGVRRQDRVRRGSEG